MQLFFTHFSQISYVVQVKGSFHSALIEEAGEEDTGIIPENMEK